MKPDSTVTIVVGKTTAQLNVIGTQTTDKTITMIFLIDCDKVDCDNSFDSIIQTETETHIDNKKPIRMQVEIANLLQLHTTRSDINDKSIIKDVILHSIYLMRR